MTEASRPLDEQYDTQMEVERDPCGAYMAIQSLTARAEEAEAERDSAYVRGKAEGIREAADAIDPSEFCTADLAQFAAGMHEARKRALAILGAPEPCAKCKGRGVIYRSPGLHGGCPTPCPDCQADAPEPATVEKARPDVWASHMCRELRQAGYLVPYERMMVVMQSVGRALAGEASHD
jgi:hypothetical protein